MSSGQPSVVKSFLVEIGTEEMPPKALKSLAQAFQSGIVRGLEAAALEFGDAQMFATPRRLAVRVNALASRRQTAR